MSNLFFGRFVRLCLKRIVQFLKTRTNKFGKICTTSFLLNTNKHFYTPWKQLNRRSQTEIGCYKWIFSFVMQLNIITYAAVNSCRISNQISKTFCLRYLREVLTLYQNKFWYKIFRVWKIFSVVKKCIPFPT